MDFFDELREFSHRIFDYYEIEERESPWTGGRFPTDAPRAAIIHYTASSHAPRALRWFVRRSMGARASAHVVIAPDWPKAWWDRTTGLPGVQQLPAPVVQCVPPEVVAWHAGWVNPFAYGIELANVGELRQRDGQWVWWPDNWARVWEPLDTRRPVRVMGRYWEPYTPAQVMAAYQVLIELLRRQTIRRTWLLGHEHVSRRKYDPGPCFPMSSFRDAVFAGAAAREPDGHPAVRALREALKVQDCRAWRSQILWDSVAADSGDNPRSVPPAWDRLVDRARAGRWVNDVEFCDGPLGLRLLWYAAEDTWEIEHSTYIFQRMMGIDDDAVLGPQTRRAIRRRLGDLGIIPYSREGKGGR